MKIYIKQSLAICLTGHVFLYKNLQYATNATLQCPKKSRTLMNK